MRQIMLLAALSLAVLVTDADAQDTGAAPPQGQQIPQQPQGQQPQRYQGPISGGVYRQPTPAEIEQRERDTRAAQQRAQQQNQEVEQLYKQLIQPPSAPAQ